MLRVVAILVLFIIFTLIKLAFKAAKTTIEAGKIAYDTISKSSSFEEAYSRLAENIKNRKSQSSSSDNELGFLEDVIALMAKVAASDGAISRAEIEYMSETIVGIANSMRAVGVSSVQVEETKQHLFAVANRAKNDDKPIYFYTASLADRDVELKKRIMLQLIGFASIDGHSGAKMELLFRIGISLQFSKETILEFISQIFGTSEDSAEEMENPYEVLGCRESDSFETIRMAYRRLVKKYHPDYLHGQGADSATVQEATHKMQEINSAYEKIKKLKGN